MKRTARLSKGGEKKLSGPDISIVQSPLSSLADLIKAEAQTAMADRKEQTEQADRLNTITVLFKRGLGRSTFVTQLFCYRQVLLYQNKLNYNYSSGVPGSIQSLGY